MNFASLVADFQLVELRLYRAVKFGAPPNMTADLARHATALMDRIIDFTPRDDAQLKKKIDFFLERARSETAGSFAYRDMNIALELMNQNRLGLPGTGTRRVSHERELILRMVDRLHDPAALGTLVDGAGVRCSMYDAAYRIVGFSRPNEVFYARSRDRVRARHVTSLVGAARYETRAKARMDAAMRGHDQIYAYALEVPGIGTRVMNCTMKPARDATGCPSGIVILVEDVSEVVGL